MAFVRFEGAHKIDAACAGWSHIADQHHRWDALCDNLISCFTVCSICGDCSLPGTTDNPHIKITPPEGSFSPYSFANIALSERTKVQTAAGERWYLCDGCKRQRSLRSHHTTIHSPAYIKNILQEDTMQVQKLSVVDLGLQFAKTVSCGYASGTLSKLTLIPATLISWASHVVNSTIEGVRPLLFQNLRTNPIIQRFLSVYETTIWVCKQSPLPLFNL